MKQQIQRFVRGQEANKNSRMACRFFVGICALSSLPVGSVQSETYFSGQIGYTLAQKTAQARVNDPGFAGLPAGTTVSNVTLNDSLMYGLKLGRYFESIPWLAIELESFMTTPHRPQQQLILGVPGVGDVSADESGATNRLIVVSPNLVVRYQAGSFEPYLGIGPGIFFLHQQKLTSVAGGRAYSQSFTGVGLNTQVGLRYRLTEHVSVYGEWKFNHARVDLGGQADVGHFGSNTLATLHHFAFGIGYHF